MGVCKAEGGLCCRNDLGAAFPCQAGGECCGNTCASPGSKCCNKGKRGYEYPVAEGTACTSDSESCTNSDGKKFQCGPGSPCCGNTCQAPGSKCCHTKGMNYAVTEGTKCAGWNSGSVVCKNRYGAEFLCGAHSSCCGNLCAGAGGVCCQNQDGKDFVCGAGSRCGKNVCLADH